MTLSADTRISAKAKNSCISCGEKGSKMLPSGDTSVKTSSTGTNNGAKMSATGNDNKAVEMKIGSAKIPSNVGTGTAEDLANMTNMDEDSTPERGVSDLWSVVNHIALVVSDVGRSLQFYTDVVGLKQILRPNFDR